MGRTWRRRRKEKLEVRIGGRRERLGWEAQEEDEKEEEKERENDLWSKRTKRKK